MGISKEIERNREREKQRNWRTLRLNLEYFFKKKVYMPLLWPW
jgi:hypothetical protein